MLRKFLATVAFVALAGVSLLAANDATKNLEKVIQVLGPTSVRVTTPVVILDPTTFFSNISQASPEVQKALIESPTYSMPIHGVMSIVVNFHNAFVRSALSGRNEFQRAALASLIAHEQCHVDGGSDCYAVQLAVWQELRRAGALLLVDRGDADNWERDMRKMADAEKAGDVHTPQLLSAKK